MKVKSRVKSGRLAGNHNETLSTGLKVKTRVKSGKLAGNHNETLVK